jgi:hypothetical protein
MDRAEIAGEMLAVDKTDTAVAHRPATAEPAPLHVADAFDLIFNRRAPLSG